MAQSFDIRFARTAGLAALLEVPENAFRWRGGGLLRIDAHGISIGLKRSLLALSGGKRTQRIPTENLRAVYREGDALRVEFQSGESARIVLPFWADDRDTAARIVRLLPTLRTLEIEHETHSAKPRADWRVMLSLGVTLAALMVGIWAVYQRSSVDTAASPASASDTVAPEVIPTTASTTTLQVETPAPALSTKSSAQRVEAPAFPLSASLPEAASRTATASSPSRTTESPATLTSAPHVANGAEVASPPVWRVHVTSEGVVPIVPGMPAYDAARRQLDLFLAESATLRGYYEKVKYDGNSNRFGQIESLWWKVTVRVTNSPGFEDPALRPLQEIELAISRAWRRAFALYADPALLVSADAEVEFAEMLEARARQFVD